MISYWKTQWWRVICCLLCIAYAIHFAAQPAGADSIEGLGQNIGNIVSCLMWFLWGLIWAIMAKSDYDNKRISLLEKKAKKYDALVDEVRALYEANQIDRKYIDKLHKDLTYLTFEVEELKK